MTNHANGNLLEGAVRNALERVVETVGGATAYAMLAEDGAAIADFKCLDSCPKNGGVSTR
jgi:hypothetical protein